jgi:hypothetical protein
LNVVFRRVVVAPARQCDSQSLDQPVVRLALGADHAVVDDDFDVWQLRRSFRHDAKVAIWFAV